MASERTEVRRRMEKLGLQEVDFEESFGPSSGPGGQHANKVATAVTLRYVPDDLSVTVQDSRSQAMNRRLAWERLLDRIEQVRRREREARKQAAEKKRRRSRPRPAGLKEKILEGKRRRSEIKRLRTKVEE